MDAVAFAPAPWSTVRDRAPWQPLVRTAFHAACLGIGEAYQDVGDCEAKVAAMSRYPDDLLACTARADGDLVGLLVGAAEGARLVIYDLFVATRLQRRGIGRRLLEAAMAASRATRVAAEVNRDNGASRALFESMGFRRTRSCDWFEAQPR